MKKILLCASLIALYGVSTQAVTFKIKDTTRDTHISFKFYPDASRTPFEIQVNSGPNTESKQDLLRYFQKIKTNLKKTLVITAAEARCWPINIENYDADQLENMIISRS